MNKRKKISQIDETSDMKHRYELHYPNGDLYFTQNIIDKSNILEKNAFELSSSANLIIDHIGETIIKNISYYPKLSYFDFLKFWSKNHNRSRNYEFRFHAKEVLFTNNYVFTQGESATLILDRTNKRVIKAIYCSTNYEDYYPEKIVSLETSLPKDLKFTINTKIHLNIKSKILEIYKGEELLQSINEDDNIFLSILSLLAHLTKA